MPEVNYTATISVARPEVWEFVRDMNNWAPLAKGYQSHEVVNDRESLWTVKGDVGPISRVTKVQIDITEWIEEGGVTFAMKGLNEPISGQGAIRLTDTESGVGTDIRANATIELGGTLGPIMNQFLVPWIHAGADELVTKIALTLQPDYQKPTRPFFLLRWIRGLGHLLRRWVIALLRLGRQDGDDADPSDST